MGVPLRARSVGPGGRRSSYREWQPAPEIAAAACGTWEGTPGWSRMLRVVPDGCIDITWDGARVRAVSAGSAPLWLPVAASGTTVGIRLRSGVAGRLLGVDVDSWMHRRVVDLREILRWTLPGEFRLRDELRTARAPAAQRLVLEQLIAGRLRRGFCPEPVVLRAVAALAAPDARVDDVAEQVGTSDRTMRRQVRAATGFGPKELHRVFRFQRFLQVLPDIAAGRTTIAAAAFTSGYTDQSHLGRECRRLSGSSLARLTATWRRHSDVAEIDQIR
ncbi:helix-turn-helix domain-containing protein [Pseudonocardia sp. TRM90224]|uniref:helix-turn-helix domain-containing protein n=1 Tax=Pseudonocardia sp. TRM90224 TaxID=2812678 RepID=UPI001E5948C6|nr:AraC family transcriptional regulator [Pseudonocardia sp. TRM90224]